MNTPNNPHFLAVLWTHRVRCVFKSAHDTLQRQRAAAGLTDSHHVVPAIQQAHAELQPVGRVAHVDESQLPVGALTDGRCPSHQEPADDEQDDAQQTQHSPAGHIGDSLGRAGEEHLQHPVREDDMLIFKKTKQNKKQYRSCAMEMVSWEQMNKFCPPGAVWILTSSLILVTIQTVLL